METALAKSNDKILLFLTFQFEKNFEQNFYSDCSQFFFQNNGS